MASTPTKAPTLTQLLDRLCAVDRMQCQKLDNGYYSFSDEYFDFQIDPTDWSEWTIAYLDSFASVLRRQFRSRHIPVTIELTPEGLAFITTCHDPKAYPLQVVKTKAEHEAIALLEALVLVLEAGKEAKNTDA